MIDIFTDIPQNLRKTITLDNGTEFTGWQKVKKELSIDCYFTHPYSSWEKGTVERMNGFIRRFFPKGTDFNFVTDKQIQDTEDWINNRPMTCLNFKTPNEVFFNSL
jgi:IS30 family transposase